MHKLLPPTTYLRSTFTIIRKSRVTDYVDFRVQMADTAEDALKYLLDNQEFVESSVNPELKTVLVDPSGNGDILVQSTQMFYYYIVRNDIYEATPEKEKDESNLTT